MGYTGWLMPDGKFYPCKHNKFMYVAEPTYEELTKILTQKEVEK